MYVSLDDLGVHHQPLGHVLQRAEDDVGRQEGLGQRDSPGESGGGRRHRTDRVQEKRSWQENANGRRPLVEKKPPLMSSVEKLPHNIAQLFSFAYTTV